MTEICPVAQLDRASDFGSEGWGSNPSAGRHSGATMANGDIQSRRVGRRPFSRNFDASRPTVTVQRSNRRRRWHASLGQKGLALFRAAFVTLRSRLASVVP